jgi:galactoside O-acetyltransferase
LNEQFLHRDVLDQLGFAHLGIDVLIHPTVVIVNCSTISIGDHVRIDPFCVLSANQIVLGSYVNIATGGALLGRARVVVEDFANTAPGAQLLTSADDLSGRSFVGPTVPEKFRGARHGDVSLRRHSVVGAGSVVLPGVTVAEGAVIGALSLVNRSVESWGVYAGVPAHRIKDRLRDVQSNEALLIGHVR